VETIYISKTTNAFYLARWLFLKKKITQLEMFEYGKKSKEELIKIICDFGFKVKEREKREAEYTPTDSDLLD